MPRRVFPVLLALLLFSALAFTAGALSRSALASPPHALPQLSGAALQLFQFGGFDRAANRLTPLLTSDDEGYITLNDVKPSRVGVIVALPVKATLGLSRLMVRTDPGNDPGVGVSLALAACDESLAVKRTLLPLGEINDDWPQHEFVVFPPAGDPTGAVLDAGELLCWTATRTGTGSVALGIVLQVTLSYWGDPASVLYLPAVEQE